MTPADLESVRAFFDRYTETYISGAPDTGAYALKRAHTLRVTDNILAVGKGLELDEQTLMLGQAAGLLHDVGRFSQFRDYGTFVDGASVSHAALSVEKITEHRVLAEFPGEDRDCILAAVGAHSAYRLPGDMGPDHRFLTRLLRDGDKLDILKVMAEKYIRDRQGEGGDAYITLDLTRDGSVSPELLETVRQRRLLDSRNVASLNDLKLLQISWVFDLNFAPAFALLKERKLMETIFSTMPRTEEIRSLERFIGTIIDDAAAS